MRTNPFKKIATILGVLSLAHVTSIAQAPINVPGFLKFEVYPDIAGATVADLVASPNFPDTPGRTFYMPSFDTRTVYPDDSHDNYGGRITGFVTPSESGDYEFYLRSDDASELWFSTDDNPINLQKIAEEATCCGPFEEPGQPETSFARPLEAGKRYAIEVRFKEGTGGDLCQVAWRRDGDPTPPSELTPMPIAFLSTMIPARGSITVASQPAGATAGVNDFVTLNVGFTASHAPVAVQWQRDGVNVPGLTGSPATLGPLKASDAGSYRAVISIPGAIATSAPAAVVVNPDVTRPTISRVVGSSSFDKLTVEYSERVTAASAGDVFNYGIDGGLSITAARVLSSTSAELTTTQQSPGATYTLTVNNVVDNAGLACEQDTSKTFTALDRVGGGLKFEVWLGMTGTDVGTLTSDPRYPASPDITAYINEFTSRLVFADASSMNDYGGKMSGWIVPTESADYEFFIRSDDNSQLSLSTDDDPLNAAVIASESGCCGPFENPGAPETSAPIALSAGVPYYIQALWKEGGGGDYCDVAWRKVGDATPAFSLPFISGAVLQSYATPGTFTPPTVSISSPEGGAEFEVGEVVVVRADVTSAPSKSITKVEFLEQGRVIGTATRSPFEITLYELREDSHTLIARATDSTGLISESEPVTFSVGAQVAIVKIAAIDDTTTWRYDRTGRDLGTEWRQLAYDDSTWPEGLALIADEGTTTVEPIRTRISRFNDEGAYVRTFYFRKRFTFGAVTPAVKLKLRHVVDDGAVFYLNGVEIHRFGVGTGVVDYLTDAAGHENIYEGPYEIPVDNLVEGENVLAAEVHQAGGSSSDMVFGGELIATVPVIRTLMTIARDGGSVRISWAPTGGTLESASSPAGPWEPVLNATNPLDVSAAGTARFYRLSR